MPGPRPALPFSLRPRVDRHFAPAVNVGGRDRNPQQRRLVLGDHERRFQGQLLEQGRPGIGAGPERHLDEGRPRQEHGPEGGVVGQPGLRVERDATAEGEPLPLGIVDRRAEQRVIGGGEPGLEQAGGTAGGVEPEALVLEGIGRQRHRFRAPADEESWPVEARAAGQCLGKRKGEAPRPPSWRRIVPIARAAPGPASPASIVSRTAGVSTGWKLASIRTR